MISIVALKLLAWQMDFYPFIINKIYKDLRLLWALLQKVFIYF